MSDAPKTFPDAREFPGGTRTADDAAAAIGCDVAAIVKSLVFARASDGAVVLVLCSGAHTVDAERLGLVKADANRVREVSGFAIGGVAPWGWREAPAAVLIDQSLLELPTLWAAAGTLRSVFPLTPDDLVARTGGEVVSVHA